MLADYIYPLPINWTTVKSEIFIVSKRNFRTIKMIPPIIAIAILASTLSLISLSFHSFSKSLHQTRFTFTFTCVQTTLTVNPRKFKIWLSRPSRSLIFFFIWKKRVRALTFTYICDVWIILKFATLTTPCVQTAATCIVATTNRSRTHSTSSIPSRTPLTIPSNTKTSVQHSSMILQRTKIKRGVKPAGLVGPAGRHISSTTIWCCNFIASK